MSRVSTRRWAIVTATVIGLGVLAVACAGSSDGEGSQSESTGAKPIGKVLDLSAPGFHTLPDPPFPPGGGNATVWTGSRYIAWGGVVFPEGDSSPGTMTADGASLDLTDGRWTQMTASPFAEGLYQPIAAFDGTEVIFIGTQCEGEVPAPTDGGSPTCPRGPAAAAWNPSTNAWRTLSAPPIPMDRYTDERVTGYNGVSVNGDGAALFSMGSPVTTLAWDRATGDWSTLPGPGDGTDLVVHVDDVEQRLVAEKQHWQDPKELQAVELWTIAPGETRWTSVGPLAVDPTFSSVGDGSIVSSRFERDKGSSGTIIDLDTLESTAMAPSEPNVLWSLRAIGPWIFSTNDIVDPLSDSMTVRRVDREGWVTLGENLNWSPYAYVGEGVIGSGPDAAFTFWRPPPALTS